MMALSHKWANDLCESSSQNHPGHFDSNQSIILDQNYSLRWRYKWQLEYIHIRWYQSDLNWNFRRDTHPPSSQGIFCFLFFFFLDGFHSRWGSDLFQASLAWVTFIILCLCTVKCIERSTERGNCVIIFIAGQPLSNPPFTCPTVKNATAPSCTNGTLTMFSLVELDMP